MSIAPKVIAQILAQVLCAVPPAPKVEVEKTGKLSKLEVKTFSGRPGSDVQAWVFSLEQNFFAYSVPEDKKVVASTLYMEGAALQWFKAHPRTKGGEWTWPIFRELILTRYTSPTLQLDLRFKLGALQ